MMEPHGNHIPGPERRVYAGLLTILTMGLLVWAGLRRGPVPVAEANRDEVMTTASETAGVHPAELRVTTLLESAKAGDVESYLDSFSGEFRRRLEREVAERGRDAFAADLRTSAKARKSHAVFAAQSLDIDDLRVAVDAVYPTHNERQTYRLARSGESWLVADVEIVKSLRPDAAFGSVASFEAPEGVPIQRPVATPRINDGGLDSLRRGQEVGNNEQP